MQVNGNNYVLTLNNVNVMTERERQLIVGVLTKVYTGSLSSYKSLDEQCEDFVSLGGKILKVISEQQKKEDNNSIKQQNEIYITNILTSIPQVNILNI